MSYTVERVPDGTFPGRRQWAVGVAVKPARTVAFVELSASADEQVFVECWRAACSPQAAAQSPSWFRPVA